MISIKLNQVENGIFVELYEAILNQENGLFF